MGARKALFVLDPPETFSPTADSTYVMVTEALRRGHEPYGALLSDLSLHESAAHANARPLGFRDGDATLRFVGDPTRQPMSNFDVVVMRKDPPVDQGFMTSTWILDRAGTLVVNEPAGLRSLNEKMSIAAFAHLTPRTYVSRDPEELREILTTLGGRMIVKPVYGFGGREILLARQDDGNLGSILEIATADGTRYGLVSSQLLFVSGHKVAVTGKMVRRRDCDAHREYRLRSARRGRDLLAGRRAHPY